MLERPLQGAKPKADTNKMPHKLILGQRRSGMISGVQDVISFDDKVIVLETTAGLMKITGNDLHIKGVNLETGDVDMDGVVNSIQYTDSGAYTKPNESIFKRIFR